MVRTSAPDFEKGTLNAYLVRGDEIREGDRYGYKVVLIVYNGTLTYCAYRGPTGWSDEKVVDEGDSVGYEVVKALFPVVVASLEAEGYTYYT